MGELFVSPVRALLLAVWSHVVVILVGLWAVLRLAGTAASAVVGRDGTVTSRIIARLTAPDALRLAFAAARALRPNLVLKSIFVKAYPNNGTAIVTLFDDVRDVLRRDQDFEVVYAPRMAAITDGGNFFLGMANTADYQRDVSNMRIAARRNDVVEIIKPFAAMRASEVVNEARGRIDVPQHLTLAIASELLGVYFGTPGPSKEEVIQWTTEMFWYLFIDLSANSDLDARALDAAKRCRAYLDEAISERKVHPSKRDDVLGRCIAMQKGGVAGMSDMAIRNNLIGLIIGAVPTTSKAAIQALDQLLNRPEALAGARRAAQIGDDALLGRFVFEALRFNPVNPIIYRRAKLDTAIGAGSLRARSIPSGTMVMASNLSAMFDRYRIADPETFRIDRSADDYLSWGDGLHTCFGAHVNQVLVPTLLKPLLTKEELRRVDGATGQIDTQGTPFPVHLWLEFRAQ